MPVPALFFSILALLACTVACFWVIDGVAGWMRERKPARLVPWIVLALLVGVNFLPRLLYYVPMSFTLAFLVWFFSHGRRKYQRLTDPLLLNWSSLPSLCLSGSLAGATLVLFFGAVFQFPNPGSFVAALGAGLIIGGPLAAAKRSIRRRWPGMIGGRFDIGMSPTAGPVAAGGPAVAGGGGSAGRLYMDEVIALFAGLPVLFFIGPFAIIGPFGPWAAYLLWSALQAAWLRWVGVVEEGRRMIANAYEVILWDDYLCSWLGELVIQWDQASRKYMVAGALPNRGLLRSLETRLAGIEGAGVDTSRVRIDPELRPDPHKQIALGLKARFG